MSEDVWDLIVVGAGPAGACAALGALTERPDARVLLLDRADFPRDKCCGDGIAPHVTRVLQGVGAADVLDGWTPLRRLELSTGTDEVAGTMKGPVHVIPREVFDARLVERAVAAGAVLRRHRVRTVEVRADRVVLDGHLEGRVLVGADGVHSVVREAAGLGRTTRRALAIRGYAPTPAGREGKQVIRYGTRHQPAYAWSFDRGDGLANVGYGELLTGSGADSSKAELMAELERLLPGSTEGGTSWRGHHLPLSGFRWEQPDGRVLLVGDAAGLVNPMTGEGIYYAVLTGVLAGRAAARAVADGTTAGVGARHRAAVRGHLGSHLRHTWAASKLTRSTTVIDIGVRAARRDVTVFDAIVDIGLGDGKITRKVATSLVSSLVSPG